MNALISVYDKAGIEDFARSLSDLGWNIYASGGTAQKLKEAGIKVTDVAELVGGQAILGHRVVTLSREIHAGLLAQNTPEDEAELKKLKIPRIDLVCVDMYPLKEIIAKLKATGAEIIEMTDIGGPTLLRAAAKGRRIVISKSEQRQEIIDWLKAGKSNEVEFLRRLAAAAELEVAKYVLESAKYLNGKNLASSIGELKAVPKYGENPWQTKAGLYEIDNSDSLAITNFKLQSGTQLSYNNYADIDRLLQTITHIAAGFDKNYQITPMIALGAKHGNVCGAGINGQPAEATKKMLAGDPRAIFGGVVMLNFGLDKAAAQLLISHDMGSGKRLLDVVVAPEVDKQALEILQRKAGKLRVVTNPALAHLNKSSLDQAPRFRYVRGGFLTQDNYIFMLDWDSQELENHGEATTQQEKDMLLAWAIGSTSNSNTITLVKNGMLIGNGVGQQDRVSAAQLAIKRAHDARHKIEGAAAYSDSFFPFEDGPLELAKAGVEAILASRGSVQDEQVAKALQKAGVAFYTLPDASARGFYAH